MEASAMETGETPTIVDVKIKRLWADRLEDPLKTLMLEHGYVTVTLRVNLYNGKSVEDFKAHIEKRVQFFHYSECFWVDIPLAEEYISEKDQWDIIRGLARGSFGFLVLSPENKESMHTRVLDAIDNSKVEIESNMDFLVAHYQLSVLAAMNGINRAIDINGTNVNDALDGMTKDSIRDVYDAIFREGIGETFPTDEDGEHEPIVFTTSGEYLADPSVKTTAGINAFTPYKNSNDLLHSDAMKLISPDGWNVDVSGLWMPHAGEEYVDTYMGNVYHPSSDVHYPRTLGVSPLPTVNVSGVRTNMYSPSVAVHNVGPLTSKTKRWIFATALGDTPSGGLYVGDFYVSVEKGEVLLMDGEMECHFVYDNDSTAVPIPFHVSMVSTTDPNEEPSTLPTPPPPFSAYNKWLKYPIIVESNKRKGLMTTTDVTLFGDIDVKRELSKAQP